MVLGRRFEFVQMISDQYFLMAHFSRNRNNGWTLFYEQTYGTSIGQSTAPIRPTGQYVILTGKAVGSSTLPVLAAAPTAQVFTETVINTPQLLNGAYW